MKKRKLVTAATFRELSDAMSEMPESLTMIARLIDSDYKDKPMPTGTEFGLMALMMFGEGLQLLAEGFREMTAELEAERPVVVAGGTDIN
jgi:hypothetical protein